MKQNSRGWRLLLVEDDGALRQMLVWELLELGYEVVAVGDCRAARAAMAAEEFDGALLDIGLPDGNGVTLAGELAERNPGLRVVLCSGGHMPETSRPLHASVLALLTKPVAMVRLDRLFRDCR